MKKSPFNPSPPIVDSNQFNFMERTAATAAIIGIAVEMEAKADLLRQTHPDSQAIDKLYLRAKILHRSNDYIDSLYFYYEKYKNGLEGLYCAYNELCSEYAALRVENERLKKELEFYGTEE